LAISQQDGDDIIVPYQGYSGEQMDLKYEIGIDDARAYSEYFVNHNPEFNKKINSDRLRYIYATIISVIAIGLFIWRGQITISVVFVMVAIGFLIVYFSYPYFPRKSAMRNLLKQSANVLKESGVSKMKLTITDECITYQTPGGESKFKWADLENVINANQHLFLIVHGFGAVIVPKRAFATGQDFPELLKIVKSHFPKVEEVTG
jgi:hypothetical protein